MPKYFSVDARAVISLGRDNAKDRVTALIELIKNSYDAGAEVVRIDVVVAPKDHSHRHIRILDNGKGMTDPDLENKWLRIGFSEKRDTEQTPDQRIQAGEKGIGRLSADRLGAKMILHTQAKDSPAVGIHVDWRLFESGGQSVTQVPLDEVKNPQVDLEALPELEKGEKIRRETGTEIWLHELREEWTVSDLVSLRSELEMMFTPLIVGTAFHVFIDNDLDSSLNGFIQPIDAPDIAPLFMTAKLRPDGLVDYDVLKYNESIGKSETLESIKDHRTDLFFNTRPCGPLELSLYYVPRLQSLSAQTISRLRRMRDDYAGVRIFRDGILVKPYGRHGDPAFDWLGLGARQASNPAGRSMKSYKLKPNQLIGSVQISRNTNPQLKDVSGREGLIQNDAFYCLRDLLLHCIGILEYQAHILFKQEKPRSQDSDGTSPREQITLLKKGVERIQKRLAKLKPILASKEKVQVQELESDLVSFDALLSRVLKKDGVTTRGEPS